MVVRGSCLIADDSHPALNNLVQPRDVEVGHPNVPYPAGRLQIRQPLRRAHISGRAVVVPIELHEVQCLHAQAAAGAVNRLHSTVCTCKPAHEPCVEARSAGLLRICLSMRWLWKCNKIAQSPGLPPKLHTSYLPAHSCLKRRSACPCRPSMQAYGRSVRFRS